VQWARSRSSVRFAAAPRSAPAYMTSAHSNSESCTATSMYSVENSIECRKFSSSDNSASSPSAL
jgi:hypothetical protein